MKFLETLDDVSSSYDLILCDVWGVLHNGVKAFHAAGQALTRARAKGISVILVSNAPRPGYEVEKQLADLQVLDTAWDQIVTSGDLTRASIEERKSQNVYHLGPVRDAGLFSNCTSSLEQADYVVCTGLFDDDKDTVSDYANALNVMLARNLLMICANPDLIVERGQQLIPCAGAIAQAYENIGGSVLYAGKPHRPIYQQAVKQANSIRKTPVLQNRILAIGDAIRTDIAGARQFEIDSLFVARGIHGHELGLSTGKLNKNVFQKWVEQQAFKPTLTIEMLI